jgi:hypothetical protein
MSTLEADVSGGAGGGDSVIKTLSSAGGSQYLRTMVEATTEHLRSTTLLRVSGNTVFEVALTTSNTLPSGKHLLVALLMSWSKVQRSNIPVNVFCQGPLPLYNHGQDVVATWASVTAYKLAQWDASGEVQHYNLMDVKHMSEED